MLDNFNTIIYCRKDAGYKSKYQGYIALHLKIGQFHSSAEVYNKSIGPVDERKDEKTDRDDYLFSNL